MLDTPHRRGRRAWRPSERLLVDRTQGNPFFLEETVRSLVEGGALDRNPR